MMNNIKIAAYVCCLGLVSDIGLCAPVYNPSTDKGVFVWSEFTSGTGQDPIIDAASDRAIFVWHKPGNLWTLKFTGGSSFARYTGTIIADSNISNYAGPNLEATDTVSISGKTLSFNIAIGANGIDDFTFKLASDADCITLSITQLSGGSVLAGADRTQLTAPYRVCPQPAGPGDTTAWRLRASPGGIYANIIGTVYSSLGFNSVVPFKLEATDSLIQNGSELNFNFKISQQWEDGIDFSSPSGSKLCIALNPATLPNPIVYVGDNAAPVAPPIDPVSLTSCTIPPPDPPSNLPNILLILTDDQRWDTLWAMPIVQQELAAKGVQFENTFVTTPLCCPSRSGFWSGGFLAHNTGVLMNSGPNGGPDQFEDSNNMGRMLQGKGYKTQFVGKYFALYAGYPGGVKVAPYIPPGWDSWVGRGIYATNTPWTEFRYAIGSTNQSSAIGKFASAKPQYTAYYERDRILDFIRSSGNNPFFVIYSTSAPHEPSEPAAGDESLYTNFVYSSPGTKETDLSDKPNWVRSNTEVHDNAFIIRQLQSLKAVDRAVGDILNELTASGKLNNTVIIFTSDNGYLWGEHGLWGKAKPHNEAMHVPLIVRKPGVSPRVESDKLIAANLDVPRTILALAGINKTTDGSSLLDLLNNPSSTWRDELLIESFGDHLGGNGVWAALRTSDWHFIDNPSGTDELYDLVNDPSELQSLHANSQFATIKADLQNRLNAMKGLNITSFRSPLPKGKINQPYSFKLTAWGGTTPYKWSIASGQLPTGLSLNSATGLISGTPNTAGSFSVYLQVQGAGLQHQSGRPELYKSLEYVFVINN